MLNARQTIPGPQIKRKMLTGLRQHLEYCWLTVQFQEEASGEQSSELDDAVRCSFGERFDHRCWLTQSAQELCKNVNGFAGRGGSESEMR